MAEVVVDPDKAGIVTSGNCAKVRRLYQEAISLGETDLDFRQWVIANYPECVERE